MLYHEIDEYSQPEFSEDTINVQCVVSYRIGANHAKRCTVIFQLRISEM